MLKSLPTSKRLMNKDSSISQSNQNHKCYFHGSYNITQFCINKKCTLPLCEKCIPIHVKQHMKEQKSLGKENIILFSQAHRIAFKQLDEVIQRREQSTQRFRRIISQAKKEIQQIVQEGFADLQRRICDRQNEIKMLTEKHNKIKKGSLKTLIFYFADEEGFKIRSLTDRSFESRITEIPQLIQKLAQQIKKFEFRKNQSVKGDFISSIDSKGQSKHQNNFLLKDQSQSLLNQQGTKQQLFSTKPLDQKIPKQSSSLKLESSSDFALLLKSQKERLDNVRNKNLCFATNYSLPTEQNNFHKYNSKSVDNFYSNHMQREKQQGKGQKQNRPLQAALKKTQNNFSSTKSVTDVGLNSQEQIQKIRKKYIGDYSLSKEKSKAVGNLSPKALNFQIRKQSTKDDKNDEKLMRNENFQTKRNELSDRILTREQIRLNIENRINQKSANLPEKQKEPSINVKQQNHETFRKPQSRLEGQSQMPLKGKHQQFTLNKNNVFNQTYKNLTDREKGMLSSIKKQFIAAPGPDDSSRETRFKAFFEGNNIQNVTSFDFRDETMTNDRSQIRQQVTDFVTDKKCYGECQSKDRQCQRSISRRKDELHQQSKQKIRLSEPHLLKKYQNTNVENQPKLITYDENRIVGKDKSQREVRRFNYLYDGNADGLENLKMK